MDRPTETIDLKKQLKHLYNPPVGKAVFVEVPEFSYLMVDGRGLPDGPDAIAAIEALYSVAYALKFSVKKEQAIDFSVMPLEGLWWSNNMDDFVHTNKAGWLWTYMIMQPEFITHALVEKVIDEVRKKKNPPALGKVRFASLAEGMSAQIMHIGPYSEEGPNIEKIHRLIKESGHTFEGARQKHHEIYLSDPRRTAPEKWKTVVRQPYV
ncbi:GyrI-like domain-containing protein [Dehalogenimonas formicexedens]|uniref:GyrI-like domain-containing protein n=1 Tax=Dehalogenimonas formicexedens TaxID=1839801 RepID=UPI00096B71AB|nr:GyrI-like domain-containing protein [Dehalogenimonas formicexedens]